MIDHNAGDMCRYNRGAASSNKYCCHMLYDARSKTINFALVRTCTNKFAATACYATTRCLPYAVYRPHLYAASVWRGFTKASDRQRIDAVLRRSKRCGYYAVHLPIFEELCENTDNQLFNKTVENSNHVLILSFHHHP